MKSRFYLFENVQYEFDEFGHAIEENGVHLTRPVLTMRFIYKGYSQQATLNILCKNQLRVMLAMGRQLRQTTKKWREIAIQEIKEGRSSIDPKFYNDFLKWEDESCIATTTKKP